MGPAAGATRAGAARSGAARARPRPRPAQPARAGGGLRQGGGARRRAARRSASASSRSGRSPRCPQPGNPRPRLFRLPADRALVNRMGFNNAGAAGGRGTPGRAPRDPGVVVGVNIGKTKRRRGRGRPTTARARARSPRTPTTSSSTSARPTRRGCATCRRSAQLRAADRGGARGPGRRPAGPSRCWSRSPPTSPTRTSTRSPTSRCAPAWTGSSRPTRPSRATACAATPAWWSARARAACRARRWPIARSRCCDGLRERLGDEPTIVSVGGVESAEDVAERLAAGATLVQAYTAFVYGGPLWPARVQRGLARRLRDAGSNRVVGDR